MSPNNSSEHEQFRASHCKDVRISWMVLKTFICLAWVVLLTIAPGSIFAGDCLDLSPVRVDGGDIYDAVVARDLTRSEHAHVRRMLRSLDGDWDGEGTEVRCKSLSDKTEKDVNLYKLRGDVHTDSYGNLLLDVDLYDEHNRTRHQQLFRLYLNATRLRYESDGGYGDVELSTLTPTEIKFIFRVNIPHRGHAGSPMRKEFYISLITEKNTFSIYRDIYTKGKLTAKWRWRFQR